MPRRLPRSCARCARVWTQMLTQHVNSDHHRHQVQGGGGVKRSRCPRKAPPGYEGAVVVHRDLDSPRATRNAVPATSLVHDADRCCRDRLEQPRERVGRRAPSRRGGLDGGGAGATRRGRRAQSQRQHGEQRPQAGARRRRSTVAAARRASAASHDGGSVQRLGGAHWLAGRGRRRRRRRHRRHRRRHRRAEGQTAHQRNKKSTLQTARVAASRFCTSPPQAREEAPLPHPP